MDLGLYIHIPFCERRCYYCDFVSYEGKEDRVEDYIKSLIAELAMYRDRLKSYRITTIFIGGGTPSMIDPSYIEMILGYIDKNFDTSKLEEVTIETNPGSLTREKVEIYKKSGINRVSVGLQTTDNEILKSIGRIHSLEDFYSSYEILKDVGIDNINVDLIFGLPDQTLEDMLLDLKRLSLLDIKHISYYGLILEPGTLMSKWEEEGSLNLPDEDLERDMYHRAVESLKGDGFIHYEISNFAKPGYECKHNSIYWKIRPYLGVGLGSHSNLLDKRFWNSRDLEDYIQKIHRGEFPIVGEEDISLAMEIGEYCIMGIRFIEGISKRDFKDRFKKDIYSIYAPMILKHVEDGLLQDENGYLSLTEKGLDLANLVEVDFLPEN